MSLTPKQQRRKRILELKIGIAEAENAKNAENPAVFSAPAPVAELPAPATTPAPAEEQGWGGRAYDSVFGGVFDAVDTIRGNTYGNPEPYSLEQGDPTKRDGMERDAPLGVPRDIENYGFDDKRLYLDGPFSSLDAGKTLRAGSALAKGIIRPVGEGMANAWEAVPQQAKDSTAEWLTETGKQTPLQQGIAPVLETATPYIEKGVEKLGEFNEWWKKTDPGSQRMLADAFEASMFTPTNMVTRGLNPKALFRWKESGSTPRTMLEQKALTDTERRAAQFAKRNMDDYDLAKANLDDAIARGEKGTAADLTQDRGVFGVESGVLREGTPGSRAIEDTIQARTDQIVDDVLAPLSGGTRKPALEKAKAQIALRERQINDVRRGRPVTIADDLTQAQKGIDQSVALVDDQARAAESLVTDTVPEITARSNKAAIAEVIEDAIPKAMPIKEANRIRNLPTQLEQEAAINLWWRNNAYRGIKGEKFKWDAGLRDKITDELPLMDADSRFELEGIIGRIDRSVDKASPNGLNIVDDGSPLLNAAGKPIRPPSINQIDTIDGDSLLEVRNFFARQAGGRDSLKGKANRKVKKYFDDMIGEQLGVDSPEYKEFMDFNSRYGAKDTLAEGSKRARKEGGDLTARDITVNARDRSGIQARARTRIEQREAQSALAKTRAAEAEKARTAADNREKAGVRLKDKVERDANKAETKILSRLDRKEGKLFKRTLAKYADDAPNTVESLLRNGDIKELKRLNDYMIKTGNGASFKAEVLEGLEPKLGVQRIGDTPAQSTKAASNVDKVREALLDAGVITKAESDSMGSALRRSVSQDRRVTAITNTLKQTPDSWFKAMAPSLAAAGSLTALPGSHQLLLGGAVRRAFRKMLHGDKNSAVIDVLEDMIANPEKMAAALNKITDVQDVERALVKEVMARAAIQEQNESGE